MGDNPHTRSDQEPGGKSTFGGFDLSLFAQAINEGGLLFRWSRAIECPCKMESADQYRPNCPLCGSDGWWYVSPEATIDRHDTRDHIEVPCIFSAQGNQLDWQVREPAQFWDSGSGLLTVQREARVGYMDRFIGIQQVMAVTEVLDRDTASDTVPVGHTGRTTAQQKVAMRYEPLRVNFIASEVDGTATIYYEGTDYFIREPTLTEPARLVWKAGRGPANGQRYAVHYDAHPVWLVTKSPYGIQGLAGPSEGSKGAPVPQVLPTTFEVMLDFLTPARGS